MEGCIECFSSGVSQNCYPSNLFITQIPMQLLGQSHGFTLTDRSAISFYLESSEMNIYIFLLSEPETDLLERAFQLTYLKTKSAMIIRQIVENNCFGHCHLLLPEIRFDTIIILSI